MVNVGIMGATGLVGLQLSQLLKRNTQVNNIYLFSKSNNNKYLHQLYPHLKGIIEDKLIYPSPEELEKCDCVFMALPHGKSMFYVPQLFNKTKIIDLGADFRLKDKNMFYKIYRHEHFCPQYLNEFEYGIPELNDVNIIKNNKYIACPGCIATAVLLSIYPIIKENLCLENIFTVDAKVGSSGSGINNISVSSAHVVRSNCIRAYKLQNHRHKYEVEEFIRNLLKKNIHISLSTYSVDLVRGFQVSIYFKMTKRISKIDLIKIYKNFYRNYKFIRVFNSNIGYERYPNPKLVVGSNFCDIGFSVDENYCIIICSLDNLIKGAAGQAIQDFNLINGNKIDDGLNLTPLFPI